MGCTDKKCNKCDLSKNFKLLRKKNNALNEIKILPLKD
jgi:hypothetical protein